MFVAAPLFSMNGVPVRVMLIFSIALTLIVMPLIPPMPNIEMFSYQGMRVIANQVMIGLASGFIVQMVFAAVIFGGQAIAYSMGLGFASMVDPQNGQQVPVVSQLYVITGTLIFLVTDSHLLLIRMLLDSFSTLPIADQSFVTDDFWVILKWSSQIFAGGFLLALPVIASLLLINISFGVATRAAPQLNIFSVGFPVTLSLGLILIWATLPNILDQFNGILINAYELLARLLRLQ